MFMPHNLMLASSCAVTNIKQLSTVHWSGAHPADVRYQGQRLQDQVTHALFLECLPQLSITNLNPCCDEEP
jgi:hypothetical protein